jgi:hypothetical protein
MFTEVYENDVWSGIWGGYANVWIGASHLFGAGVLYGFARGGDSYAALFNGYDWSETAAGTADWVGPGWNDIWGASDCDVFAVGEGGRIIRY